MILFVGITPSKQSPDSSAFHPNTKSGKTLRNWIDQAGLTDVAFENIDSPTLIQTLENSNKVVALGVQVSKKLDKVKIPYLKFCHPSGLNRQLNDQEYVRLKLIELKEYCHAE